MIQASTAVLTLLLECQKQGRQQLPSVTEEALRTCAHWTEGEVASKLETLAKELDADFAFIKHFAHSGNLIEADRDRWMVAWRGTLAAVEKRALKGNALRVLLASLGIIAYTVTTLREYVRAVRIAAVEEQLVAMIESTKIFEWTSHDHRDQLSALESAVRDHDFESIVYLRRGVMPEWRLDFAVAVLLLFSTNPVACANAVESMRSALAIMLALLVLEEDGLTLAAESSSASIKFLGLSTYREDLPSTTTDSESLKRVEQLLLQMASSPLWAGWVKAMRLPSGRPSIDGAFARVLSRMDAAAWRVFIEQTPLRHSLHSIEPMKQLLAEFERCATAQQAQLMWKMIFDYWDAWNYGLGEADAYHGWLPVTAFDHPVAKHYAVLGRASRDATRSELEARIANLELEWFPSLGALLTVRNVLQARLLLVALGHKIAADADDSGDKLDPTAADYLRIRYQTYRCSG